MGSVGHLTAVGDLQKRNIRLPVPVYAPNMKSLFPVIERAQHTAFPEHGLLHRFPGRRIQPAQLIFQRIAGHMFPIIALKPPV